MKINFVTRLIAAAAVLGGTTLGAMAQTTDTVVNNQVVNSTFTFSDIGVSGITAVLDQTTIPNLNNLIPPVAFVLTLTSITYDDTQDTFVGTGVAPTLTFTIVPTLQQQNTTPSAEVTLVGPVIPSGTNETGVIFTLQNPVSFLPPITEQTPGNQDEGTGTFTESLSNLHPTPETFTLVGTTLSSGQPIQVNNNDFSFGGTLEIFYAAPEPSSVALGAAAAGIMGVLIRRRALRS